MLVVGRAEYHHFFVCVCVALCLLLTLLFGARFGFGFRFFFLFNFAEIYVLAVVADGVRAFGLHMTRAANTMCIFLVASTSIHFSIILAATKPYAVCDSVCVCVCVCGWVAAILNNLVFIFISSWYGFSHRRILSRVETMKTAKTVFDWFRPAEMRIKRGPIQTVPQRLRICRAFSHLCECRRRTVIDFHTVKICVCVYIRFET